MLIYLTQEIFIAASPISNLPFFTHTARSPLGVNFTRGSQVTKILLAITRKRQTLGGRSSPTHLRLAITSCLPWFSVNTNCRVFWAASIAVNTRVDGLANLSISLKTFFAGTLIRSWSKSFTHSIGRTWRRSTRILSLASAALFSVAQLAVTHGCPIPHHTLAVGFTRHTFAKGELLVTPGTCVASIARAAPIPIDAAVAFPVHTVTL